MFIYDLDRNGLTPSSSRFRSMQAHHWAKTFYVVHKSTEKWIWLVEYGVHQGFDLVSDKYIKKKLLWEGKVPYVVFRGNSYDPDKKYYLNHALRLPPRLGVLPKDPA